MDAYDRIEKLMLEHGEKASDLAKATGMSTGLLSQWKSRMQKPSATKLAKVAAHYGVTTDYLLGNQTLGSELQKIIESESERLGIPEDELTQVFLARKPVSDESIKLNRENVAHYFDTLYSQKENAPIDAVDEDLRDYLDELRNRPEMRMLFSTTKNATKAQIEAIVKMVEEMQGDR
ncbi:helix-turn-helix transcriptional regulator [Oscillibacter sp.]|uniref:helix-turn-helix domain-containing protein n=1 Tax=Oscillibacter sp. TaxID=1945593 RepID=UPI0028A0D01C|nr:helix-turn-helix transcriptional regulator [Oscillibacter sp.]